MTLYNQNHFFLLNSGLFKSIDIASIYTSSVTLLQRLTELNLNNILLFAQSALLIKCSTINDLLPELITAFVFI